MKTNPPEISSAYEKRQPTEFSAVLAEALAVVFISVVVFAANFSNLSYILFPELGALSSDVFLRPSGKWASSAWKLVATPSITAVIGIIVNTNSPNWLVAILLTMVLSIGVVFLLRSNVAPAISAGVLPIVLGVTSWMYPICIFCTLAALVVSLEVWKRSPGGRSLLVIPAEKKRGADDVATNILESRPKAKFWFVSLLAFVTIVGLVAQASGWRFILFPPLVVIAYEMLGHPNTCPWASQAYWFPVACTASALVGMESLRFFGVNPFAAGVTMVASTLLLRGFRLRMPPVHAIGLIPFAMPAPDLRYVASVGIGTIALTIWFGLFSSRTIITGFFASFGRLRARIAE